MTETTDWPVKGLTLAEAVVRLSLEREGLRQRIEERWLPLFGTDYLPGTEEVPAGELGERFAERLRDEYGDDRDYRISMALPDPALWRDAMWFACREFATERFEVVATAGGFDEDGRQILAPGGPVDAGLFAAHEVDGAAVMARLASQFRNNVLEMKVGRRWLRFCGVRVFAAHRIGEDREPPTLSVARVDGANEPKLSKGDRRRAAIADAEDSLDPDATRADRIKHARNWCKTESTARDYIDARQWVREAIEEIGPEACQQLHGIQLHDEIRRCAKLHHGPKRVDSLLTWPALRYYLARDHSERGGERAA